MAEEETKSNEIENNGAVSEFTQMVERQEKANQEAKRLNEEREAQIRKMEALAAKNLMGGTIANVQPQPQKEETPSEYVDRITGRRKR